MRYFLQIRTYLNIYFYVCNEIKDMRNEHLRIILVIVISILLIFILSYFLLQFTLPHLVIGVTDFGLIVMVLYIIQKMYTKSDL